MFEKFKRKLSKIDQYEKLIDTQLVDSNTRNWLWQRKYLDKNYSGFMGLQKGEPRFIDIVAAPNVVIQGSETSGKDDMICSLVASLALKNYKEHVEFLFIDTQGVFDIYKDLPHTMGYASTPEEIDELVAKIVDLMNYRHSMLRYYNKVQVERVGYTRVFFVFDDLSIVQDGVLKDITVTNLEKIIAVGNEFGIHCILGTKDSVSDIMNDIMLDNYKVRIMFNAESEDASMNLLHVKGAEKLEGTELAMGLRIPERTARDDDEPEDNFKIKAVRIPDSQIQHMIDNWKNGLK